jgi:hypothetical protein
MWELTPFEVIRYARDQRAIRERELLALAWQTAAMTGAVSAGKLQPLKEYVPREEVAYVD